MLPAAISRALSIPAARRIGTIADVEHIVVFMQENRSFDHYFGHLRGVRGYNDRFPIRLPNGNPVWKQPRESEPEQIVLPFHLDCSRTSAQCVRGLDHSWSKTHAAMDGGRYNRWPAAKTDLTMGYYLRADIPFHYALADAFTVCDHYFCSLPGQTHPNRLYLMTGMIDPTGSGGGPALDNNDIVDIPTLPPFTWTTYPERLEAAGISWQIYQQGLDSSDEFEGNYGLNVLANFKQFIEAPKGSSLHRRGMSVRRLETLAEDVMAGRLPQVSWILPPAAYSEHPRYRPSYGADYIARILDALTADPDVWSKTVLLIMYDENDGYFDHVPPPQPPTPALPGKSTVTTAGETHDFVDSRHQPLYSPDQLPYGLGPRVPMIVVSPWSKGGFVCSQVFDHTSVIRFIETRFGVAEPNITPWRRSVCGDLTSAFDFASPNDTAWPTLPDTKRQRAVADEQCRTLPEPVVPDVQTMVADGIVAQEAGTRPARPLPYELHVHGRIEPAGFAIQFVNSGGQGAHFYVYSTNRLDGPRRYTVEAGKTLSDNWQIADGGGYALSVHGPNGYFRQFGGRVAGIPDLGVQTAYDRNTGDIRLIISNSTRHAIDYRLRDNAYGGAGRHRRIAPDSTVEELWPLAGSNCWYDLTLTIDGHPDWRRRFAGHIETDRISSSDPAAQAPVLAFGPGNP
jgi:phospholipase C